MATRTVRTYRQILCPVDFSKSSAAALRYAAEIAHRSAGEVTVLFVNDPLLDAAAAAAAYNVHKLADETERELRRLITRALGPDAPRVHVVTSVGHPAPEIRKIARRVRADLIVMGARGLRGPGKWLTGSTTEHVLRTTEVPVLVVPQVKRGAGRRALGTWPRGRALVPVDLVDGSTRDVDAAVKAARALGATPVLFHSVLRSALPAWLRVDPDAHDRTRTAEARRAMASLAARVGTRDVQVAVGDPSREIVAAAAKLGAGVIVLTLKRSPSPLGPRRGSITYRVLCDHVAPVLAIPET